eukprot:TRINITY_DN5156_c0_g1_i1.p1 TRINITY_DN5156_c0_g1~~TRINITY_DN5156_c0_g1_i1.p1  ORF type:complete len:949 (-),score=147.51 TRINITY_DN5156_c0_g1_i1:78-2924(-)
MEPSEEHDLSVELAAAASAAVAALQARQNGKEAAAGATPDSLTEGMRSADVASMLKRTWSCFRAYRHIRRGLDATLSESARVYLDGVGKRMQAADGACEEVVLGLGLVETAPRAVECYVLQRLSAMLKLERLEWLASREGKTMTSRSRDAYSSPREANEALGQPEEENEWFQYTGELAAWERTQLHSLMRLVFNHMECAYCVERDPSLLLLLCDRLVAMTRSSALSTEGAESAVKALVLLASNVHNRIGVLYYDHAGNSIAAHAHPTPMDVLRRARLERLCETLTRASEADEVALKLVAYLQRGGAVLDPSSNSELIDAYYFWCLHDHACLPETEPLLRWSLLSVLPGDKRARDIGQFVVPRLKSIVDTLHKDAVSCDTDRTAACAPARGGPREEGATLDGAHLQHCQCERSEDARRVPVLRADVARKEMCVLRILQAAMDVPHCVPLSDVCMVLGALLDSNMVRLKRGLPHCPGTFTEVLEIVRHVGCMSSGVNTSHAAVDLSGFKTAGRDLCGWLDRVGGATAGAAVSSCCEERNVALYAIGQGLHLCDRANAVGGHYGGDSRQSRPCPCNALGCSNHTQELEKESLERTLARARQRRDNIQDIQKKKRAKMTKLDAQLGPAVKKVEWEVSHAEQQLHSFAERLKEDERAKRHRKHGPDIGARSAFDNPPSRAGRQDGVAAHARTPGQPVAKAAASCHPASIPTGRGGVEMQTGDRGESNTIRAPAHRVATGRTKPPKGTPCRCRSCSGRRKLERRSQREMRPAGDDSQMQLAAEVVEDWCQRMIYAHQDEYRGFQLSPEWRTDLLFAGMALKMFLDTPERFSDCVALSHSGSSNRTIRKILWPKRLQFLLDGYHALCESRLHRSRDQVRPVYDALIWIAVKHEGHSKYFELVRPDPQAHEIAIKLLKIMRQRTTFRAPQVDEDDYWWPADALPQIPMFDAGCGIS